MDRFEDTLLLEVAGHIDLRRLYWDSYNLCVRAETVGGSILLKDLNVFLKCISRITDFWGSDDKDKIDFYSFLFLRMLVCLKSPSISIIYSRLLMAKRLSQEGVSRHLSYIQDSGKDLSEYLYTFFEAEKQYIKDLDIEVKEVSR